MSNNLEDNLYMYKAKCYNVVDGDTADFMLDVGFKTYKDKRVRFLYVDTPERGSKNFNKATDYVIDKILDKKVILQTYKSDSFGRYLGVIWYKENEYDEEYRLLSNDILDKGLEKPGSDWNEYQDL